MSLESALASLEAAVTTLTQVLREGKPTATKPPKATKPAASEPAVPAAASAPVATPTVEPTTQPATALVPVAAVTASPPGKEPTIDDVRTALVQCQTRKGGRDVPQAILAKYSPTKVTGGVPKDKYAALIAECNAA